MRVCQVGGCGRCSVRFVAAIHSSCCVRRRHARRRTRRAKSVCCGSRLSWVPNERASCVRANIDNTTMRGRMYWGGVVWVRVRAWVWVRVWVWVCMVWYAMTFVCARYSHAWLIWGFHANTTPPRAALKGKVRPPRGLGAKLGCLATRSPHRPNALGLTLVRVRGVDAATATVRAKQEEEEGGGRRINTTRSRRSPRRSPSSSSVAGTLEASIAPSSSLSACLS